MQTMEKETLEKDVDTREVIIEAKHLGVKFSTEQRDDYKSKVFNLFRKKEKEEKEFWPIKDISFKGYKGEILGIIGTNGAGKTTLCKILTGIFQHDKGDLRVDGKISALFSFGMGINRELTGRENVYLNGMMLGINKDTIDEYIEEIHEFSELGDFFEQPMKNYSSGMRARLGFSVASHLEPEILILDEALNTGDAAFSRKAAQKMKELVKKAKMVIIVTHSLRYAKRHCDRLMWLENGTVREIGEPEEIIEKYKETVPPRPPRRKRNLDIEKTETEIKDNTIVKVEDVGISFDVGKNEKFWALRNVNFEIKEGEVVGIIGHNGAGKSTLCKVLTDILAPDEGTLTLNGDTSALLGYGTGFNAQLTGRDNIYLNGMLLGIPKKTIEEKFPAIVEFSGLEKFIDRPIKNYSSGMRSRLGFSVAAVLEPDIFIIDEALSTGDMAFQQKASERIQDMMESAKAVIIVTHSMTFVEKVCTRAIWMERGTIQYDGDAEEAVRLYREKINKRKKTLRKTKKKVKKVKS